MKEIEFKKSDGIKVVAETVSFIDSLQDDKEYILTIKEKAKKRSLNANNYFWLLCDKLAVKTGVQKTDIYRQYIKEIGGNNEILCIKTNAVEKFRKAWSETGLGYVTDIMPSKINGCTNVVIYYGSSTYDSKQMSRLIKLITQDCIENNIPTLDDIQFERLMKEWKND